MQELNSWLHLTNFDTVKKYRPLKNLFDRMEIREKPEQEMNRYAQKALGLPLEDVRKKALFEFADMLLVREDQEDLFFSFF